MAVTCFSLAPWIPVRRRDLKRICEIANFKPGEIFYDLGCGDGRVVIYASKNYSVKSIGLELSLPFYILCVIRGLINRNKKIQFKFKNLFNEDLRGADVVYLFAQSKNKLKGKIVKKLEDELKSGARVISYSFPIEDWQPEIISKPTKKDLAIYLYKIKK